MNTVLASLIKIVGSSYVLSDDHSMEPFIVDWRGRYHGNALCVVLPASTEEVAEVIKICSDNNVAVVPQGGNTSLCEGAIPRNISSASVVVNLRRMNRVRSIDVKNSSMEVEAGCVLANVHAEAEKHNLLYPVSLGSEGSCQIGGTIATNAGGTSVLKYGNTRDNVLGLEVVLANGTVWNGLYRLRKNNTGFDLKNLFIGSEGVLGIITSVSLKLHPLPTAHAVAWVTTKSPAKALKMLAFLKSRSASVLSAYEMMNDVELNLVLEHVPGRRSPIQSDSPWHVLIELSDTSNEQTLIETLEKTLEDAFEENLITDASIAQTVQQYKDFWEVRHSVSEANKKAGVGINTDCAVPLSEVPRFIEEATVVSNKMFPQGHVVVVAHLGDGNVHFISILDHNSWRQLPNSAEVANQFKHAINEIAVSMGGTFSAEHGIGQLYIKEMENFKPAIEIEIMKSLKQMLDPNNIMNPGRLLELEPIH